MYKIEIKSREIDNRIANVDAESNKNTNNVYININLYKDSRKRNKITFFCARDTLKKKCVKTAKFIHKQDVENLLSGR